MYYIASVALEGLYIRELGLSDVLSVVHHQGRIIDASETAKTKRVRVGQTIGEAKLLTQGQGTFVAFNEEEFRTAKERWLSVGLTYTSAIEPRTPAHAFFDLSGHPRPDDIAATFLHDLWRHESLPMWVGIGPVKWVAEAAMAACDATAIRLGILPVEPIRHTGCWLENQKPDVLCPLDPMIRERLKRLGAKRVSDIQQLSLETLGRQFGKQAIRIHQVAQGTFNDPVQPTWPKSSWSTAQAMAGSEDDEQLTQAIKDLSRTTAHYLSTTDQAIHDLTLFIHLESGAVLSDHRSPKQPLAAASQIATHLLHLRAGLDVAEPVETVRILLTNLAASKRRQLAFLNPDRSTDALATVQSRLNKSFGAGTVVMANQLPTTRLETVLKAYRGVYEWP